MQRFRVPRIALGAFLAGAVLVADTEISARAKDNETITAEDKLAKAHAEELLAFYTLLLAVLTGFLAVATVGLCFITYRGAKAQARDMRDAVDAAIEANGISRQNMMADQRPWLSIDNLTFQHGIVFTDGRAEIPYSVKITNVGKTPAQNISMRTQLVYGGRRFRDTEDALQTLAQEERCRDRSNKAATITLLPGQSYWESRYPVIVVEECPSKSEIAPVVIGCVNYQIAMDQDWHQTSFAYYIFECKEGEPQTFLKAIEASSRIEKNSIGWNHSFGTIAT